MSDDRFGDRVSVTDLSDEPIQGALPHPNDPWANASSVETPFSAHLSKPSPESKPQVQQDTPSQQVAPVAQRPVPKVARITRKDTATLTRFREIFGLSRISVQPVTLERRDPRDSNKNVAMEFGLRGVNHEDYQWILGKVQEIMQNPKLATFAWKIAFISIGVASMDGTPIWEVFGFESKDPEHTKDPMYPHIGLRFQAAELLCDELRTSLFDTVESLYSEYELKIDSKYLPKKAVASEEEAGENPVPLA